MLTPSRGAWLRCRMASGREAEAAERQHILEEKTDKMRRNMQGALPSLSHRSFTRCATERLCLFLLKHATLGVCWCCCRWCCASFPLDHSRSLECYEGECAQVPRSARSQH